MGKHLLHHLAAVVIREGAAGRFLCVLIQLTTIEVPLSSLTKYCSLETIFFIISPLTLEATQVAVAWMTGSELTPLRPWPTLCNPLAQEIWE